MKVLSLVLCVGFSTCLAVAQGTDGVVVVTGRGASRDAPAPASAPAAVPEVAFIAPPVLAVPALTSDVVVVETVVTTNTVTTLTTNRVERHAQVVTTNATLQRFVIDIDTKQTPTRFIAFMSDGSVVVTPAGKVGSLTNRAALSTVNGLLCDVIGSGQRNVNTNTAWRANGTNTTPRLQRVWSASGAVKQSN